MAPGPCLGAIALATRRNNFGIVPRYRNRALFGAHSCCSDLRFLHLRRPSLRCRRRTNVSVTLSCSAIMAGSTPRAARMASSPPLRPSDNAIRSCRASFTRDAVRSGSRHSKLGLSLDPLWLLGYHCRPLERITENSVPAKARETGHATTLILAITYMSVIDVLARKDYADRFFGPSPAGWRDCG